MFDTATRDAEKGKGIEFFFSRNVGRNAHYSHEDKVVNEIFKEYISAIVTFAAELRLLQCAHDRRFPSLTSHVASRFDEHFEA